MRVLVVLVLRCPLLLTDLPGYARENVSIDATKDAR